MSLKSRLFFVGPRDPLGSLGLLLLRVGFGGLMIVRHGWPKLMSFQEKKASFPDPLGVGHELSMTLACVGETLAPALLIVGLATRLSAVPAAFTMAVAAFLVHGGDPLAKKEMALIYLVGFLAIGLLGPGRYSLDRRIGG
jgi:putative oxidoreductase